MSLMSSLETDTFDPSYFPRLAAVEDEHFWFRGRRDAVESVLRPELGKLASGYRVLEVGCGSGGVLRRLVEICSGGTVVGMDLHREGLRYARSRVASPLVQADLQRAPFGGVFDLVGMFDVLEHFPADEEVLETVRGLLREGGLLVVTVPARRVLWSGFDRASRHARRYETEELGAKLERARFEVEFLSPYMATIFPLVFLARRLARDANGGTGKRGADPVERELRIVPVLNSLLAASLRWEPRRLAKRKKLPFGTSLLALARKSSPHNP